MRLGFLQSVSNINAEVIPNITFHEMLYFNVDIVWRNNFNIYCYVVFSRKNQASHAFLSFLFCCHLPACIWEASVLTIASFFLGEVPIAVTLASKAFANLTAQKQQQHPRGIISFRSYGQFLYVLILTLNPNTSKFWIMV